MASTALFWHRPQPSIGMDTRNATACALARRTISASDRNSQPRVVGRTLGAASAVNSRETKEESDDDGNTSLRHAVTTLQRSSTPPEFERPDDVVRIHHGLLVCAHKSEGVTYTPEPIL